MALSRTFFAAVLLGLSWAASPIAGAQTASDLALENDYIKILVNQVEANNMGRFSVETTGGDPERVDDDNQLMLYRRSGQGPSTSYTTVRIDGTDYVFGGPTDERAGRGARHGRLTQPPTIVGVLDQQIVSSWLMEDILVTQTLSFSRSFTTGLLDTALISYTLENQGDRTRRVGLRLMLDTMLGNNDGAPFRIGDQAVLTDLLLQGDEIPVFWQAFDSLHDPKVMAQGTFRGEGLTVPDRVFFSNWGALADGVWEFDFQPGRDFTRLGEFDLDSALALYWDPQPLAPGERRTYATQYGLGGLSIVRGDLTVGITAPATLDIHREDRFTVIAYVQNTGEGEALDVEAEIKLPRGLALAPGQPPRQRIGNLPLNADAQVTWDVVLDGAMAGEFRYAVEATAENLPEPVRVERGITLLGPPAFNVIFDVPQRVDAVDHPWTPTMIDIRATVRNSGDPERARAAEDVQVEIRLPLGMNLTGERQQNPVDRRVRRIGSLAVGEERSVRWQVALGGFSGNIPFDLVVTENRPGGVSQAFTGFVQVNMPERALMEVVGAGASASNPARVGEYVSVDVGFENLPRLGDVRFQIRFDPERLAVVEGPGSMFAVYPGDIYRLGDGSFNPLRSVHVDKEAGLITIEAGRGGRSALNFASGVAARIEFEALAPGQAQIEWETVDAGDPVQFPQEVRRGTIVHIAP